MTPQIKGYDKNIQPPAYYTPPALVKLEGTLGVLKENHYTAH